MSPHLVHFEADSPLPGAILLEFIPDLRILDLNTFTEERSSRFRKAMTDIHQAGVLHDDIQPRHFLIQETTDRTVILDFDRAQTHLSPTTGMSEDWRRAFDLENELIDDILGSLVRAPCVTR